MDFEQAIRSYQKSKKKSKKIKIKSGKKAYEEAQKLIDASILDPIPF
jgi:ATP-dependent protease HslVU (ClpYQ) ATPase subunit